MSGEDQRESFGVHIGPREIYDQVVGMREDVRSLIQDREAVEEQLDDHETRLRSLERFRYAYPVGAIAGLLGGLGTIAKAAGII